MDWNLNENYSLFRSIVQKSSFELTFTWMEEDWENAMHEVLSIPGTSVCGVVNKFEIKELKLRFWLKKAKSNDLLCKSGWK